MSVDLKLPWREGTWAVTMCNGDRGTQPRQSIVNRDGEEMLLLYDPAQDSEERHEIIDAMLEKLNAGKVESKSILAGMKSAIHFKAK